MTTDNDNGQLVMVLRDNPVPRLVNVPTTGFCPDEQRQIAFREVYQRPENDYTELMDKTRLPNTTYVADANAKHLLNMGTPA